MVNSLYIVRLRNAEYFQFMTDLHKIVAKFEFIGDVFRILIAELHRLLGIAEVALLAERRNDLVRQKNEADNRRDRAHSRLFNYLKYILDDDQDPRFNTAQEIMRIIKEAGNPRNLPENAQTAMMTALARRLQPLARQLAEIGATQVVENMNAANEQFIAANDELRQMLAARKLDETARSMTDLRKDIDRYYVAIIGTLGAYALAKPNDSAEMIAEVNVLIRRFDAKLAARTRRAATATTSAAMLNTNVDECDCG